MNHTTRDDLIGYVERDMVRMTLHETIREHVENGGDHRLRLHVP